MNSIVKYPWGPLLLKQTVDPSITNEFIRDIDICEGFRFSNFNSIEKIVKYDISNKKYLNLLYPYINQYLNVGNLKYKFELDLLIANIYKGGESIPPHVHGDCDLSFVLFLQVPLPHLIDSSINEGSLVFEYGESVDARAKTQNINRHLISPEVNKLLIFPNNLRHYSLSIKHPQSIRITLAGNIKFK